MLTVASCKSIWSKVPQTAKAPLIFLSFTLPTFFMSPKYIEGLFVTGYEDTLFHIFFFSLLAYLLSGRKWLFVIAGLFLLGVSIELFQALLPNRGASLSDILADSFGIFLGVSLKFLMLKIRPKFPRLAGF
jgi:hypothetical protein